MTDDTYLNNFIYIPTEEDKRKEADFEISDEFWGKWQKGEKSEPVILNDGWIIRGNND